MKLSPIKRALVAAGLIVATPAIAAGLIAPTQTRSSSSLPTSTTTLSPQSTTFMTAATTPGRGSPILVPGDSPG